jgi:DNA invertase Pin-like site-specific DNA recombinase
MKRAVIYARVSTRDKQETENQLRQLRDFCRKMEWELTREYVDRVSGKHGDREQFQAMFAAASRREFDCVLFWALDRFTREGTLATLQYLQRLTGYGIDYKGFTEQYLDSCGPFRDAVIGILATIAKQERIRLSERVLAGLERARAQGRVGGRPPLPEKTRRRVLRLRATGISFEKIAAQVGISKMSVCRIVARKPRVSR